MKKFLVCLMVLGMVSSASAVGVYMAAGADSNYSFGNSVAVASDGTAYLSGQVFSGGVYRGAYWTLSSGALTGPTLVPANAGLTVGSNAHGIAVLANDSLLVHVRQPADGAATWSNVPGSGANGDGYYTHFISGPGTQGIVARDANVIRTAANGTSFYIVGKASSSSTNAGHWTVDTLTGAQTWDSYGLMSSGASVNGISVNGVAAGTTNDGTSNRAYVHDSSGTTLLPTPDGGTGSAQGFEISADGNTITGMAQYGTRFYQAYWKKTGSTWAANWIEEVTGATSTCALMAVNEDGSLTGGYAYGTGWGGYKATISDMNDLDTFGQPKVKWLEDYLTANGVTNFGTFTKFDRITSISTVNGLTYIGGRGYEGTAEKGFLIVVPEPATAMFLALGGLAILRRRAR